MEGVNNSDKPSVEGAKKRMDKNELDSSQSQDHVEIDFHCIEECKYERKEKKNGRKLDMVKCSLCGKWFHNDCVGLKKDARLAMWPCPKCCDIFQSFHTIRSHIDQNATLIESLKKTNETLRECLDQAHRDIERKQRECSSLQENEL